MRLDQLSSPGNFKGAQRLLMDVHSAINFMEIASARSSGQSEQIDKLREFLQGAVDYLDTLKTPPKSLKRKDP